MSNNVLIRNLPTELRDWISDQREQMRMSQQEFLLKMLKGISNKEQLNLFEPTERQVQMKIESAPFSFIDLFAGIGGFRIGLEATGGQCLFSCEWDVHAQKTYQTWFNDLPQGDITGIDPNSIPDHDILAAGFPCQPFSIAGGIV